MELRTYQKQISKKATSILNHYKFVYLAMEVRTGKTLTSLDIANNFLKIYNVLFITKKKAIPSIEEDYEKLKPKYSIRVTNYEQLHNIDKRSWDVVIVDEAHSLGAFPKPSKRAKQVKDIIITSNPYVIFLSGTPTPESAVSGVIVFPFACPTSINFLDSLFHKAFVILYIKSVSSFAEVNH